ncbi:protein-tyrosine-phosphatase [Runella limosa]|uniref:protein-tyrosine-phosphatase n=1 Tax=Runella limosa TaxID=370978 RepID=UPI00040A609F|nr:protein-tyrosine-phosphatase [Runella limosa]
MKLLHLLTSLFLLTTTISFGNDPNKKVVLNESLQTYISTIKKDFVKIPKDRKKELDKIALFVQNKVKSGEQAQLTYICTHNSRRSHFGQIWAATAAAYYGIPNVKTYSGGTESTAFNERAVATCKRAGFEVSKISEDRNPIYEVKYAADAEPLKAFSKKYDDKSNPQSGFCAIMTCSQADEACPLVKGATRRIAIPYDDPKAFDGTPEETAKYDERCKQIATETLYIFSKVKI